MLKLFRRATPEDRERARLDALLKNSRSIEGTLNDKVESLVYFTYEVRGVTYHAAQDVSVIEGAVSRLGSQNLGPVTVRYSTTNPANSMVLSQSWSGLNRNLSQGTNYYAEPIA